MNSCLIYCIELTNTYYLQCQELDEIDSQDEEPIRPIIDRRMTNKILQQLYDRPAIQVPIFRTQSPISTFRSTKFDESYVCKPYKIKNEHDLIDEQYRQEFRKKKKDKLKKPLDKKNNIKQIDVRIRLPQRKLLLEYQTFEFDGNLLRLSMKKRSLTPLQKTIHSYALQSEERKSTPRQKDENITNTQELYKQRVQNKVRMIYEPQYNFDDFQMQKGVKLYYDNKIKTEIETQEINVDDQEQEQDQLPEVVTPNARTSKLPPRKPLISKYVKNSKLKQVQNLYGL
ncbi:hypothetical protein pb186bvf_005386 [Paramecium bursaria]